MSNVTANATAAFITYNGGWDYGDGSQRMASAQGASASLSFSGTAFYLYGQLSSLSGQSNYSLNVALDGEQFLFNNPQLVASDGLLYNATNLDPKQVHTAEITLQSGTFSLSRIVWTSSAMYAESEIIVNSTFSRNSSTLANGGQWQNQQSNMGIFQNNASITFNFQGNGIVIQGRGSPNPGTTFKASMDWTEMSDVFTALAPEDSVIDLYRIDALEYGDHTVTLTTNNGGPRFCVSKAKILALPPTDTSSPSVQSLTDSPTTSPTTYPVSNPTPFDPGQVAVVIIIAFLVPIIAGGIIIFYRRRRMRAARI